MRSHDASFGRRALRAAWPRAALEASFRVITILLATLALVKNGECQPATEYEVKAAFIYNFAKFVEWPPSAHSSATSSLVVGVLGQDPFGLHLDRTVEGKTVNGRKLVIKRFTSLQDLSPCHILFISTSEREHWQETFDALRGKAVLTIGEIQPFAQAGGMVNFFMENNRVRFEINLTATGQSELKISSQLLKLAKVVK